MPTQAPRAAAQRAAVVLIAAAFMVLALPIVPAVYVDQRRDHDDDHLPRHPAPTFTDRQPPSPPPWTTRRRRATVPTAGPVLRRWPGDANQRCRSPATPLRVVTASAMAAGSASGAGGALSPVDELAHHTARIRRRSARAGSDHAPADQSQQRRDRAGSCHEGPPRSPRRPRRSALDRRHVALRSGRKPPIAPWTQTGLTRHAQLPAVSITIVLSCAGDSQLRRQHRKRGRDHQQGRQIIAVSASPNPAFMDRPGASRCWSSAGAPAVVAIRIAHRQDQRSSGAGHRDPRRQRRLGRVWPRHRLVLRPPTSRTSPVTTTSCPPTRPRRDGRRAAERRPRRSRTPRRGPRLALTVTPKRDRSAPYRFAVSGELLLPSASRRPPAAAARSTSMPS